jgi:hypothetical protein
MIPSATPHPASRLSERTHAIADTVRATWPADDPAPPEIYVDRPAVASKCLGGCMRGFAVRGPAARLLRKIVLRRMR